MTACAEDLLDVHCHDVALDVHLLVVLPLLLVVQLFELFANLLLYSKPLFLSVVVVVLHSMSLFCGVLDVFVRRHIEALLSELQDLEVVYLPLFDVQFNDAVVTKMSFQNRRCNALGVDVSWIVVRCHSLDVPKACSLDVLHEEVSQSDVLRPFVEAELVAEAEC